MGAENLGDERSQRELDIVPLNLVEPYETLHNVNCPCSISEGNSHFHENAFFIIGIDQISLFSARRCYILNSHFTFSPSPPLFLDQNFSKQAKKLSSTRYYGFLPPLIDHCICAFDIIASIPARRYDQIVCVCEKLFHF